MAQNEPDPVLKTIAVRIGRSLHLNGDDEFVHLADGDISPAGAFDIPSGVTTITFGICLRFLQGEIDERVVLMSKHADADPTGSPSSGWWIERTAENTLKAVVVDGAGTPNVSIAETTVELAFLNERGDNEELPWYHVVFLTLDPEVSEMNLWASLGEDQGVEGRVEILATSELDSYVATTNTDSFAIGAVYDGTPSNEDLLAHVEIAWAGVWNEVLPDALLRELPRFQFPPMDRRLVSLWTWTEKTKDDWNRTNQNDLSSSGVGEENYVLGPDRHVRPESVSAQAAGSERAGAMSATFPHFRPEPAAEGHFYSLGHSGAPPLSLARTTLGSADPPPFDVGLTAHCSVYGRWCSMYNRETGPDDVWRLYDMSGRSTGSNPTDLGGWEPLSKISGDADFRNPCESWDSDALNAPMRIFGFAEGTGGGTEKFLEISGAPLVPVKAGTVSLAGAATVRQVLYDARENGYCYIYSPGNTNLYVIDVSTPGSPSLAATLGDVRFSGIGGRFVQVGTRLYLVNERGLCLVDITTPASPTFELEIQTDPVGSNDDDLRDIVVLQSRRRLMTGGAAYTGSSHVLHLWDIGEDPDNPELVKRIISDDFDEPIFRLFRRGTVLFPYTGAGGTPRLHAWALFDEENPRPIAKYSLRDYHDSFSGVTTYLELDRDTLVFLKDVVHFGYFDLSAGYGRSTLRVDFEVPTTVIENPSPPWELEKLHHDLARWDMEDDAPGGLPSGFTQIGANSTVEVSADYGLTGKPPTSWEAAQSLKVQVVAPDTQAGVREKLTPASGDLGAGRVHVAQVWYFSADPAGGFDPSSHLQIEVEESGGALSGSKTYSPTETAATPFRWYRFELHYPQEYDDSTDLELKLRVDTYTAAPVYFDALRFGPGGIYALVSGRQLDYENEGQIETDGVARAWTANYQDFTHDIRVRDTMDGSIYDPQTARETILEIVADHTRSKDQIDTENVSAELGNVGGLEFSNDEDPVEAIRRTAAVGQGEIWVRDRQLFAEPVGFQAAPVAISDTFQTPWEDLKIKKSIANLVTEGKVQGDASLSDRPRSSYVNVDVEAQIGKFKRALNPNADVKTATGADNLRDRFRGLLGKPQYDGSVTIRNEPRLRPGQIMPVQIELNGWDFKTQILSVAFSVLSSGDLIAAVQFSVLKQDAISTIIPQRTNRNDQRGQRQIPEDAGPNSAWLP